MKSISNSTGSPGGKTGSPGDLGDCTSCHTQSNPGAVALITSDIPENGYEPSTKYSITASINNPSKVGFEITSEADNSNLKVGEFFLTNPSSTKFTNNNNSITHTNFGNTLDTWSFDWESPPVGTGDVTFYGAFIQAGYPLGANIGDYFSSSTLTINEAISSFTINKSSMNDFFYDDNTKKLTLLNEEDVVVYNTKGKIAISSNQKTINLSGLSKGIYIIKTKNQTKKINLN